MGPRGARPPWATLPAGTGPYSATIVKILFVLRSSVSVLAPTMVVRFCSIAKLVTLITLMSVIVPLPCELKISFVATLNSATSKPPASGN